jgi:hypothetical protein
MVHNTPNVPILSSATRDIGPGAYNVPVRSSGASEDVNFIMMPQHVRVHVGGCIPAHRAIGDVRLTQMACYETDGPLRTARSQCGLRGGALPSLRA